MKLKRMMALVLCFAMVLSTMNFSVFAEEVITVDSTDEFQAVTDTVTVEGDSDEEDDSSYAAYIGEQGYEELQLAIDAVQNGSTITLASDCADDVIVVQAPDVTFTIDGDSRIMSGTITVDGKSAAYATAGLTIKNVNFDATGIAKDASINLGGSNATRYTSNVTVDNCTFTGTGNAKVAVKNYTGGCKNVSITNCTATGLHSLAQLKTSTNVTVTGCEVTDCKNGISLGSSTGVTISDNDMELSGYGVRADGGAEVTVTDCQIDAFIPVVVRNASADAALTFNGTNTMTESNTDGIWCAIGLEEYGDVNKDGLGDAIGDVVVTLNDTGLSMAGVYGAYEAPAATREVATKADLDTAIANAADGDTILLTADIDYGAAQLKIEKAITLDLGGKTLTNSFGYGGLTLKGGCSIKNGTVAHKGTVCAIKAWDVILMEDLVIDVAFKAEGKVIGGIVLQENCTGINTIKNVTIRGAGLTNGIETYNCGNAAEPVIGSMENVTIDAVGTGMLISAPCGTATNCDIRGGVSGIEIWIKGTYSASLDLVNSTVEGGAQAVYAHDEFNSNPGVVNAGTITLTSDDDTTFESDSGKPVECVFQRIKEDQIIGEILTNSNSNNPVVTCVASIGNTYYANLQDALAAAQNGDTIVLLADAAPALTSQRTITKGSVIDLGGYTLTLTEDDLYFGTTTFQNGTIVVDSTVKPSTAVFWMFANQTLTFDNVKLVATGVTGTYLIGLDGDNADLNLLNGSEIVIENTTALDLDVICVNASTGNDIVINNSKVNVTNLDGRVFFRGNYTVSGNSDIDLSGITKAGFRIEAGQTLTISDTATVDIPGEPRDGGIHLTDTTAVYTVADTATVNATINRPGLAGSGTETDPFLISNTADLIWLQEKVDEQASDGSTQFAGKYFKLTADIDLAGINWNPIGSMTGDHGSFKGVFDGDGHTISNLTCEQAGNGLGLFARTTDNAEIKNLTINNVTVKSTDNSNYVGGVVGNSYANTKINNVYVTGTIDISGRGYIGGISGHGYVVMDNVSVKGEGTIYSTFWCTGGILGYGGEGTTHISNAVVEGTGTGLTITSAAGGLGAIIGMAEDNNGTQPISGENLTARNVDIKTYVGGYGTSYADYALGYLYGGNPTSELTGTLIVEDVTFETSTGETAPAVSDAVARVDNGVFFDLQNAIDAADGKTVALARDVVLTDGITVAADKTVVLELNGRTISMTKVCTGSTSLLVNNGDLTINDSSEAKTGKIVIHNTNTAASTGYAVNAINNRGTLTVNGGAIENVSDANGQIGYAIDAYGAAVTTINGGTINATGSYYYDGIRQFAVNTEKPNTLTVTGGTISSIWMQNTSANKAADYKASVTVAGGNVTALYLEPSANFAASVTNGYIGTVSHYVTDETNADRNVTGFITGGTFGSDVSAFCADGFVCEANADDTYGIVAANYVAEINGIEYTTLEKAIAAAQPGDTIVLLANVEENVTINKNLTINGEENPYTGNINISGNVDVTIQNVNFVKGYIDHTSSNASGNLAVKGCSFANGGYAVTTSRINSVTIEDCAVTNQSLLYAKLSTPNITVKNVNISGGNYVAHIVYNNTAYFENVTATNMTGYGIQTQNYGPKTITLKNCSFDTPNYKSIAVRDDRTQAVDTFIFEGENTMTSMSSSEYAKYVLGAADATLEAPAEHAVTTNLNMSKIVYEEGVYKVVSTAVAQIGETKYETLAEAFAVGGEVKLLADTTLEGSITVAKDQTVVLDLNGKTITGTDTTDKNFGLIQNNGTLTVKDSVGGGALTLTATVNSGWNRYSAVISNNPGGTLVVESGTIKHLGGTDMAYGIDSLTNGTIGDVNVTINGGTVKSAYRAIRQFLNSDSKQNVLTINGGVIKGDNKAIFFHDPSAKANNGTITIGENADVNGGVYLFVTEGSTEWPVTVSIAASALDEAGVTAKNVPEGLEVQEIDGVYGVVEVTYVAEVAGKKYKTFAEALAAADAGDTITLLTDVTLTGKLTISDNVTIDGDGHSIIAGHTAFILETSSDCTFKNVTLDTNNKAKGVKIASGNVVFDNVIIPNSNKSEAITVYGTLKIKNYFKAESTYQVFDARSGSITVDEGTVFDFTSRLGLASPATSDLKGAVDTEGNPFFCAYGSTTYYTSLNGILSVTNLTLLDDVTLNSNLTLSGTLNLNGKTLTVADGKTVKISSKLVITGGTIDSDFVLTSASATLEGPEGLTVTTTVADHKVVYENGVYSVAAIHYVAEANGVKYETLAEAVAAGSEVTLLDNITLTAPITVTADKIITIDLKGMTVSYDSDVAGEAMITNKGDLTITDSTEAKNGQIIFTYTGAADSNYGKGNYTISNGGTLTLEAGTVANDTAAMSHACYAIDNNSINSEAALTINGGKVVNENNYAIRQIAGTNKNTVNINGGEVTGTRAVWIQLAGSDTAAAPEMELNVTDGVLTGTKVDSSDNKLAVYSYSYGNNMGNVVVNISGGTFNGDVALTGGNNKTAIETVSITGGTFTGRWGEVYSYGDDALAAEAISITGGTFATDAAAFYAADDGYVFVENANGTYGVEKAKIATIYDTHGREQGTYTDLQTAIDSTYAGDIVKILTDAKIAETVTVGTDKDMTLELNGCEVKLPGILNYGTLTIQNGTLTGTEVVDTIKTVSGSSLTLTDVTATGLRHIVRVDGEDNAKVTAVINSGSYTVTGTSGTRHALNVSGDAEVVVKGGTFVGPKGTTCDSGSAVCVQNGAVVTIEGGNFSKGKNATLGVSGTLTVHGGVYDQDPTAYVAEGYAALPDLNDQYIVGVKPTATINNLGAKTIPAGDYMVYGGGTNTEDMPLSFVMQFLADQDAEDMATSPYAEWYGDFVITFTGIENGSFTADGCYLAGFYGDFGWVKVPVDGMRIKEGARYPVMLGVGMGQKYEYICSGVKDFLCALYLSEDILLANPNLQVNLELSIVDASKGGDAAANALVEKEGIYEVADREYTAKDFVVSVAKVGENYYTTLAEAVAAAKDGETITLLKDASGDGIVIDKSITIDLNGFTYTIDGTLVGSSNTKTNGFQILKDNTVVIKDGKLVMDEGAIRGHDGVTGPNMLIQNYADLTLENVEVTGSSYTKFVVSNNSGDVAITGTTSITAKGENYALDVYDYSSAGYEAPVVTVEISGTITGKIEVTGESALDLKAGTIVGELVYEGGSVTKADAVELAAPEGYEWVNGVLTEKAEEPTRKVVAKGYSLSLEGVVFMNVYFTVEGYTASNAADIRENVGMYVWDKKDYTGNPLTSDLALADKCPATARVWNSSHSEYRYMAQTDGIVAAKLGDELVMVPYAEIDGVTYLAENPVEKSPRVYAESNIPKASTDAAMKNVLISLMNYGAAAQQYFYKTDSLMNDFLEDDQKVLGLDSVVYTPKLEVDTAKVDAAMTRSELVTSRAASLSLKGAINVNYYFEYNGTAVGAKLLFWKQETYTADGAVLTEANADLTVDLEQLPDGSYYGDYKNIPAAHMGKTLFCCAVFTNAAGKTAYSGVISYSPMYYACNSQANDNTALATMMQYMAVYGNYANIKWPD